MSLLTSLHPNGLSTPVVGAWTPPRRDLSSVDYLGLDTCTFEGRDLLERGKAETQATAAFDALSATPTDHQGYMQRVGRLGETEEHKRRVYERRWVTQRSDEAGVNRQLTALGIDYVRPWAPESSDWTPRSSVGTGHLASLAFEKGQKEVAKAVRFVADMIMQNPATIHTGTISIARGLMRGGSFKFVKILGEGAYGRVYLVEGPDGKLYAIKIFLTNKQEDDGVELHKKKAPATGVDTAALAAALVSNGGFGETEEPSDALGSGFDEPTEDKAVSNGGFGATGSGFSSGFRTGGGAAIAAPVRAKDDKDPAEEAQREARVLNEIDHRNIVQLLHYTPGDRQMIIEYVPGHGLLSDIKTLHPMEARERVFQVCQAVDYLARKGIVHRDIKPANIRVTPEGTIKVLDFGLATLPGQAPRASSGTPGYMSPEQVRSQTQQDHSTDMWALGITAYQLLNKGAHPLGDYAPEAYLYKVGTGMMASEVNYDKVDPPARDFISRCFSPGPAQRLNPTDAIGHPYLSAQLVAARA